MPSKAIIVKFLKIFVLFFWQCTLSHVFLWTKIYKKSFKNGYQGVIFED